MGDDKCLMRCIRILHVFKFWNQWRFCRPRLGSLGHQHFGGKYVLQNLVKNGQCQTNLDARWCLGRDEKILETLKFEAVWFIPVLFYVMVVFSVVVPIASRFNYQVDMLVLLINHPCAGATPCQPWACQPQFIIGLIGTVIVTPIQRWRISRRGVLRTQNHKQTLGIELTCSIVATSGDIPMC